MRTVGDVRGTAVRDITPGVMRRRAANRRTGRVVGRPAHGDIPVEVGRKRVDVVACREADDADLPTVDGDDADLHASALPDELHTVPVPLLAAVLELREHDGVGQKLEVRQGMSNVKRDSVFDVPADQPENGVLN